MRAHLLVAAAAVAGLLATLPLRIRSADADATPPGTPILPLSDVRPGMKGYGLTVFRGTEPERFDVEVIDVLRNFRPRQDLILIKTLHPRLEVAKVVAGMSGSPIFLNDKMIGAYAYGWTFPSEAVAGVTPIEAMRADLARPTLPALPLLPEGAPKRAAAPREDDGTTRWAGAPGTWDLREHAQQVAGRVSAGSSDAHLVPATTPLLVGGMSVSAIRLARDLFGPLGMEPLQAGGGGGGTVDPQAPTRFVDGGAVGVRLIQGDISAMPLGTVTRVEGDRLVGFGHPMMMAGATSLPTAIGRVLWIMATAQRSFKLGEVARPLGALVNDRSASIVVDQRVSSPTIPVTVDIEGAVGAPHPHWQFEVAHEKFMTAGLLAMGVGSAIEATTNERRDVTWVATTEIAVKGYGTLRVEDAGVAVGGMPDAGDWGQSRAVRAVGTLLNNPWEPVAIERVATKMRVRYARDVLRLRGVEALSDVVDAGDSLRLRLSLQPWSGPMETRVVEVPIPRELAGRDVDIELTPGYAEVPEVAAPESVRDLIGNLPRQYPAESLIASIKLPDQGVTFRTHVARRLPPSALDTLRPSHDSAVPEPFASYARTVIPFPRYLDGKDRVRIRVRASLR